jgi:fluoroquinolone transport system permease protein
MQLPAAITKLGRNDTRLIGRDSFLTGLFAYLLIVALAMRFALPWLAEAAASSPDVAVDVTALYPLIVGYMILFLGAVVAGMMIGFVILDERDDGTLIALMVTPLPLTFYLAYRVLVPALLAFIVLIAEVLLVGIHLIPLGQTVVIAAAMSLVGSMTALFTATFAQNKAQGFALMKIAGSSGLLLVAAWFVAEPLQYLFGLFPPYWFVKAYWLAAAGDAAWPLFLLIGVAYSALVIGLLIRRFVKVARG